MTPIRVAHTLTPEKESPQKKRKFASSQSLLGLRDGTRIMAIREATSPYMKSDFLFSAPTPPMVVVSYKLSLKDAMSPFRATILGTIHDLDDAETTTSGELRRNFKLADDGGKWIPCVAHGRHANNAVLEDKRRILAYFCCGRPAMGSSPQTLWLFKDAFIVPLERRASAPLSDQIYWA